MAITQHTLERRKVIAAELAIDEQYAYQIIRGIKTPSPALARRWAKVSPVDPLWDLRPDDWHVIWPELINTPGAPDVVPQVAA